MKTDKSDKRDRINKLGGWQRKSSRNTQRERHAHSHAEKSHKNTKPEIVIYTEGTYTVNK